MHPNRTSTAVKLLLALALLLSTFAWGGAPATAKGADGAVYVLTNAASGNAVAVFDRDNDGSLTPAGTYPTGGLGTGAGLGSQGALVLSDNGRRLFAVNAGSDEISSFAVRPNGLELLSTVPSGGDLPISLTVDHRLLYVLNAGGAGNITGFTVGPDGALAPLAGSTRPLSGAATNPAQVSFSPNGRVLVVTEKATNQIDTYQVGHDGLATGPAVHPSAGTTPFGFAFARADTLVVSEAFGGMPNASAASSYDLANNGNLTVISGSAPTHQTAACWVAATKNGHYAYTTNAGSGSVTGYRVHNDGSLSLLDADGLTGSTGAGSSPIDAATSENDHFLYALTAAAHTIVAFRIHSDGSLTALPGASGLPVGAVGLAVR